MPRTSHRMLLVGSLLLSGALDFAVLHQGGRSTVHSYDVSAFLQAVSPGQRVRVSGDLVHGSLCRIDDERRVRFALQDRRAQLPVELDGGPMLDTVCEVPGMDLPLLVEGERCVGCRYFQATQVFTRAAMNHVMGSGISACIRLAPAPLCAP